MRRQYAALCGIRQKIFFISIGSLLSAAVFFVVFAAKAGAATFSFGQNIFPVVFVYMDERGLVDRIWSNVTEKDSAYAVKFFNSKGGMELSGDSKNIASFVKSRRKVDVGRDSTFTIEFRGTQNGIEEIRTIS